MAPRNKLQTMLCYLYLQPMSSSLVYHVCVLYCAHALSLHDNGIERVLVSFQPGVFQYCTSLTLTRYIFCFSTNRVKSVFFFFSENVHCTYNLEGAAVALSCRRDTLYPWAGLPIKPALIGTHVDVRLETEEPLHSRRRLRPRQCLSGKPLVFHLRYAFEVLQIRSQCQNPGGRIITSIPFMRAAQKIFYVTKNCVIFARSLRKSTLPVVGKVQIMYRSFTGCDLDSSRQTGHPFPICMICMIQLMLPGGRVVQSAFMIYSIRPTSQVGSVLTQILPNISYWQTRIQMIQMIYL